MSTQTPCILAIDQGTTSCRSIIFDRSGVVVAVAQKEFTQIYPQPGWVEHDPLEIWAAQKATVAEVLSKARACGAQVTGIGVTNQRETTVIWERATGRPVHNAIVWQDRRTADECARLKTAGVEPEVAERTGLRLDPYFSGTKVCWILDHVPGARAQAEAGKLCFGTIDSWLIWQLTGGRVHVTDASNASRTLLFNLRTGSWDDRMLDLLRVPRAILPEVRSSSEIYGKVEAGLQPEGVPIAGIAGDQQAALFGQACFRPGMAKNTYGTGCFMLMNTGDKAVPSSHNLLTTVAWKIGGKTEYALEGSVFIAGAAIQWLRDELKLVNSAAELDELAASVPDSGGAILVPAFAGLGAPHWDPYARGTLLGLTRGTGRAHLCRAVLESIAFQVGDLVTCMEKDSGVALKELRVDGGAARSAPMMQFQADLLGVPVVRPKNIETTAMGAAYLAGLAVGLWTDRDDISRQWAMQKTFTASRPASAMAPLRRNWERALERAMKWETSGS